MPNEEHVFSRRELEAFQAAKARPKRERPELDRSQIKVFLSLIANLSTHSVFERRLGLSGFDVEFYKNKLQVVSERDARSRLLAMENEDETLEQKEVIARIQESREAEAIANQRLEDIALQQIEREPVRFDKEALRKEDKERQQRLSEQENKVTQVSRWRLPLSGRPQTREEELVRFRNDIQRRGLAFTASKHACEKKDVRAEAIRLGLKIDWDRVRR